ncbi:MAG: sporulation transcription factor Spo0A [Clostridia bacterium]
MHKLKLLIVDDNIQYCNALEAFFGGTDIFDVLPSAYNGVCVPDRVRIDNPDVMILDMVMPHTDGIGVLQQLRDGGLMERIRIFANSSFIDEGVVRLSQELGVAYFMAKPMQPQSMMERMIDILEMNNRCNQGGQGNVAIVAKPPKRDVSREQMITNYLRILGVPAHASGYIYLKTGIDYCVENYGKVLGITTIVYPYIAKVHDSMPKRVERNIRHAIEYAWNYGNIEAQHRIFGYTVTDTKGRPTNKEFIALITDKVVLQLKYR